MKKTKTVPAPRPIPALISKNAAALLLTGKTNNFKLIDTAIDAEGLQPAGEKAGHDVYRTRDLLRAVHRYKAAQTSTDRRNNADADLKEFELERKRDEFPDWDGVEAMLGGLVSVVNNTLDDDRFPQELRQETVDKINDAYKKELAAGSVA